MFTFPRFMNLFVGFRMGIRSFGRVRQSLVSAVRAAHGDGEHPFRTVIVSRHSFGNRFWVSGIRCCWPSLQALRAETMVDGLPPAFGSMRGGVVIRDILGL